MRFFSAQGRRNSLSGARAPPCWSGLRARDRNGAECTNDFRQWRAGVPEIGVGLCNADSPRCNKESLGVTKLEQTGVEAQG